MLDDSHFNSDLAFSNVNGCVNILRTRHFILVYVWSRLKKDQIQYWCESEWDWIEHNVQYLLNGAFFLV